MYRGHPDLALAAWKRVPPEGPFGARAALQCGMLAMSSGQLTRAEEILQAALRRGAGADAPALAARIAASLPPRRADRRCAAGDRRILGRVGLAGEVVKQLSRLDAAPLPLETTRRTLEKAAEDDDRVWLARANLAIRTGQFDRAAEWLDACVRRRPRDSAVWRSRLELSRATGDLAGAWRALEHLPADALSPTDLLRLRAWLASRTGNCDGRARSPRLAGRARAWRHGRPGPAGGPRRRGPATPRK